MIEERKIDIHRPIFISLVVSPWPIIEECACARLIPSSPWHHYQRCFTKDVRDKRATSSTACRALETLIHRDFHNFSANETHRPRYPILVYSKSQWTVDHWNDIVSIVIGCRSRMIEPLPFPQAHTKGESHHNGRDAGTETHRGEHEDSEQREIPRRIREGERQVHPGCGRSRDTENQAEQQNYLERCLSRWTSKEGHHGAEKDDDWWKWRTDRWVRAFLSFPLLSATPFVPPSRIVLSVCIRCLVNGSS